MSDEIRVRDRKTGNIRTVTRKAYMAMGPKVYEKLGDEPQRSAPQVHRTVSAPVVRPQIMDEPQGDSGSVTIPAEEMPAKKKPGRPKTQISSASDDAEK